MFKDTYLIAALKADERTQDLAKKTSQIKDLVEILNTSNSDYLIQFASYLEENCGLYPSIIFKLIQKLLAAPQPTQILGKKILKLWLLFITYETAEIIKTTSQNKAKRQKVENVFSSFSFSGSNISTLIEDCWRVIDEKIENIGQIIEVIVENKEDQIKDLFTEEVAEAHAENIATNNWDKKSQEQRRDLIEDYKAFPQRSIERYLQKELILAYAEKFPSEKDEIAKLLPQFSSFNSEIDKIKQIYEKLNNLPVPSNIQQRIKMIKQIKIKKQLFQNIEQVKKCVMPIDAFELQRLISKTEDAQKCIEGKDAILFIGNTGSGKSTTILKFLGYTLRNGSYKQISTLVVVEQMQKQHLKFCTSSQAKSCTRYMSAAFVPQKMYPLGTPSTKKTLVVTDSPGFGDSAGAEVDIANGVGMINALKKARSVRVVIILPYESFVGDKMSGAIKIGQIISNLFFQLTVLQSVKVLFNKFPKQLIKEIPWLIESKLQNLNSAEKGNQKLRIFLEFVHEQSKNKNNFIDPLSSNFKQIFQHIVKLPPIDNVASKFQYQFSALTKKQVLNYVQAEKGKVKDWLNDEHLELAQFHLYILLKLKKILHNNDKIKEYCQELALLIKKRSQQQFANYEKLMNQIIGGQNNPQNLENLKQSHQKLSQIHRNFKKFQNLEVVSQQRVNQMKQSHKKKLIELTKTDNIQQVSQQTIHAVINFSKVFKEQSLKTKVSEHFIRKYEQNLSTISKKIKEKKIEEMRPYFERITIFSAFIQRLEGQKTLKSSQLKQKENTIKKILKGELEEAFNSLKSLKNNQRKISEVIINSVKAKIKLIRQITDLNYVEKNNSFKDKLQTQIKGIESMCKKMIYQLQTPTLAFEEQNEKSQFKIKEFQSKNKQIKLLMQVQNIKQNLSEDYQYTLQNITQQHKKNSQILKEYIKSLKANKNTDEIYKKIDSIHKSTIIFLQCNSIVGQQQKNNELISSIQDQFVVFLDGECSNIKNIHLKLLQIDDELMRKIEMCNSRLLAYNKMAILGVKIQDKVKSTRDQLDAKLKMPFEEYLQNLKSFMKQDNHYKHFTFNLDKLERLSFFFFKLDEIFMEDIECSMLQSQIKTVCEELKIICDPIHNDAINFIKSQFDFKNHPPYLTQLVKILLSMTLKKSTCVFLSRKINFEVSQNLSIIKNKLLMIKQKLKENVAASQKKHKQLQQILAACSFYADIEHQYQLKSQHQKFGFHELRIKCQQKYMGLLKNDEDKLKILLDCKPSEIPFDELEPIYKSFCSLKGQGKTKRELITSEFRRKEQRLYEDIKKLNLEMENPDKISNKLLFNEYAEAFKESVILERELNNLYTEEDKKKIKIRDPKTGQNIVKYYRISIERLQNYLKQLNANKVSQQLQYFGPFQNTLFSIYSLEQNSTAGQKSQQAKKFEDLVTQKSEKFKQKILNHPLISPQQKNYASQTKVIRLLVLSLSKAVEMQLKEKYHHEDSNNYSIDQDFKKYYSNANEQVKKVLLLNVERYFQNLFSQYKSKYNDSQDTAEGIKKTITQASANLPGQMQKRFNTQFFQIEKQLQKKNQQSIQQTAVKVKKDAKNFKSFFDQSKKSLENNNSQNHGKWVKQLNQIYLNMFEEKTSCVEKLKILENYFLNIFKQNRQYFQKDKKMTEVLSQNFVSQLKSLRQEVTKKFGELRQFFNNPLKKGKGHQRKQQVIIIFQIYDFFVRIEDNELLGNNKQIKSKFVNDFAKSFNQCVVTYNEILNKRPQYKLSSEEIFDHAKMTEIKTYIHKVLQAGDIMNQVKALFQNIQPSKKIFSLKNQATPIKQYKSIIQIYASQFEEIRNFVKNFEFYGEAKRNMPPKQIEQDLEKLNIRYRILMDKQDQFVQLLSFNDQKKKHFFKEISKQIQEKFENFTNDALKQIKQTFERKQSQGVVRVNLLMNQLEIMRNKGQQYSFMKKDKVTRKLDEIKNVIKRQFANAAEKCKELLLESKRYYKDIYQKIKKVNEQQKRQMKSIQERLTLQLNKKMQELKDKIEQQISKEADQKLKEQLRRHLYTESNSIKNDIQRQKQKEINELLKKNKKNTDQLTAQLSARSAGFSDSIIIYQKALIDISYNVNIHKNEFQEIVNQIKKAGPKFVEAVQSNLEKSEDSRSIGKVVLNQQSAFNYKVNSITKLIKGQDIDYVVSQIQRISINGRQKMKKEEINGILKCYKIFKEKYQMEKKKFSESPKEITINYLISPLKALGNEVKEQFYANNNSMKGSQKKIHILAGIFALWAILKAQVEQQTQIVTFNIEPHPTQITTLFLLLGICQPDEKIANRLAQVGTGEGKSIVLAGLCSYLALVGFKIRCACYSLYLSGRDSESFKELFQRLGVENSIKYGTFNQLCEDILNSGGKNLKKQVENMLISEGLLDKFFKAFGQNFISLKLNQNKQSRTILVIDEVDVFFEDSFFGKTYCPAICLKGEEVTRVLHQVWNLVQRSGVTSNPTQIIRGQAFKNLVNRYPTISIILENQVHGMIAGALNFKHDYQIDEKKIVYKDGDAISHKINYGYKTVFANIYEFNNGRVSQPNLDQALQISLMVAQFSYAQLPSYFVNILGVTGTLQVLPKYKKELLGNRYKIIDQYAIPSAFGINKKRTEQYLIVPQAQYQETIIKKINQIKDNRPIIIFFKGPRQINEFFNSAKYQQYMKRNYNLTQCHDPPTRNSRILTAVNPNNITLMSSVFGRGTDFVLLDDRIKQAGGLHVIHAFLSHDQSEEIQIKGRTARQNSKGSYECILSQDWLEEIDKQLIKTTKNLPSEKIHAQLWKARQIKIDKSSQSTKKMLQAADKQHKEVFQIFTRKQLSQKMLVDYVFKLNKYPLLTKCVIKTILCLDATGSMSNALQRTCEIIGTAFQRSYAVLANQKTAATIEVKIKVYRNYNCPFDEILQGTAFQSTPGNLKAFLQRVGPKGGMGNEALQVLFQSLNKEETISQVILIGDAAPNTKTEVTSKRASQHGQSYWIRNGFPMTHIDQEISQFKSKKCPVHSFYLNDGQGFKDISYSTGGKACPFEIHSSTVTQELAGFIVKNILAIAEKETGNVNLVQTYRRMYMS